MLTFLYIPLSLAAVSFGAELLVRSASILALRLGVSPLFIGLTIVGFGTSSPELGASVTATLQGLDGVSVGNVLGSNIFNISIILAITAVLCPIRVQYEQIRSELKMAIFAAMVPFLALLFDGKIPRLIGVLLIGVLGIYIVRAYLLAKGDVVKQPNLTVSETEDSLSLAPKNSETHYCVARHLLLVLFSFVLLILGSRSFVINAVTLAQYLHLSELVIGLTIVSVGTSLPELVTSLIAARKGNVNLAVGNILGSNIFNIFGILGISATLHPQKVSFQSLILDTPYMLLVSLALTLMAKSTGFVSKSRGLLLLGSYLLYLSATLWISRS